MKKNFLLIFVSIFTALVVLIGGTVLLVVGINNSSACARLDGIRIDSGELNYLASYYKLQYIKGLRMSGNTMAEDSEQFFSSTAPDGRSYAENFDESFKEYISALISAADLYVDNHGYTSADKRAVSETVKEILKCYANGSKSEFNKIAKNYGFDYKDFGGAARLQYMASRAKEIIYGANGENLVYYPSLCNKYLKEYTHVSLIFVRTEQVFKTDSEGNLVYDENGNVALRDMTDEEKAEKQCLIDEIGNAITDGSITPEKFSEFLAKSDGDKARDNDGYYFCKNAAATAEFSEKFDNVVNKAYEMQIGEFSMVECSIGVCFIYKTEVVDGAYEVDGNPFFSDFYADASIYLYSESVSALSSQVKFGKSYEKATPSSIPMINDFYVRAFNEPK